jgi:hypothetical protein
MLLTAPTRSRDEVHDPLHRSHHVDVGDDVDHAAAAGIRVHTSVVVHGEWPTLDVADGLTDEREQRERVVEANGGFVVVDAGSTLPRPPVVEHRAEHGRGPDDLVEVR